MSKKKQEQAKEEKPVILDRFKRPANVISEETAKIIYDKKTGRLVERVYIIPPKGVKIRDYKTMLHIPAKGKSVKMDAFWFKRIQQGDVIAAVGPAETEAETTELSESNAGES